MKVFYLLALLGITYAQNHVLSLDGVNDFVQLPSTIINTQTSTIEAWVHMEGTGGGIDQQNVVFEQRHDATGCNQSSIVFYAETRWNWQTERIAVRSDTDCGSESLTEAASYGHWNHYAAVIDEGVIRVYMNGVLRDTTITDIQGNYDSMIDHISIGKHTHDAQAFGYFYGMMDEVRIWSRALTATEIQEKMFVHLMGNEQDLIGYWDFENSSNEATDQTSRGNHGIYQEGASAIESELPWGEPIWGDLNNDGFVNISDVIALINYILGM